MSFSKKVGDVFVMEKTFIDKKNIYHDFHHINIEVLEKIN
jgi:hypothetical protein